VILKASGGGGGRGMKIVRDEAELSRRLSRRDLRGPRGLQQPRASTSSASSSAPRHIEFQVVADQHGAAVCVGERECRSSGGTRRSRGGALAGPCARGQREEMDGPVCRAVRETGYHSLGTMEFLLDERGELYFMEMNTRVQVEHPVTEMVTGLDLVAEQILIARGGRLAIPQRLNPPRARHRVPHQRRRPVTFAPSPGRITEYHPPGGAGVRVDSGVYGGWTVPPHYDSLLAKVIVHAGDARGGHRAHAPGPRRVHRRGHSHQHPLHKRIIDHPRFQRGRRLHPLPRGALRNARDRGPFLTLRARSLYPRTVAAASLAGPFRDPPPDVVHS
jgi:acetyl-CoA carboxylase biotin carboxylase subunit